MAIDLNTAISATVSFDTYAPNILSTQWQRVKVLGVVDYSDASRYAPIPTLHAAAIPSLPPGVSRDATKLTYLKILLGNGDITAVALQWIIDTTFVVETNLKVCNVQLANMSVVDESRLRKLLLANGFKINSISFVN